MPRPTSVTLLALAVLSLGAFNGLGALSGALRYDFLRELPLSTPPAYLIASHVFWAFAFSLLAVGLWRLKHWGRLGTLAGLPLYLAQGWLERLLLSRSEYAREVIPFLLLAHGLAIALVWGILLRARVRRAFSA